MTDGHWPWCRGVCCRSTLVLGSSCFLVPPRAKRSSMPKSNKLLQLIMAHFRAVSTPHRGADGGGEKSDATSAKGARHARRAFRRRRGQGRCRCRQRASHARHYRQADGQPAIRSGQVGVGAARRGEAGQDGRARSPGTQRGSSEMMVM